MSIMLAQVDRVNYQKSFWQDDMTKEDLVCRF